MCFIFVSTGKRSKSNKQSLQQYLQIVAESIIMIYSFKFKLNYLNGPNRVEVQLLWPCKGDSITFSIENEHKWPIYN